MKKEQLLKAIMASNNLSADTLKNLSAYTLKNLSAYTLNNLSAYTLKNLSADTLNNLSADTLKNLKILETTPLLEFPYTHLLNDINDKKKLYKQSTFGEITKYDEKHICETPMCIGGHFVAMAKEWGYEALKKFGYGTTAGLLHLKAYPNAPVFNYSLTDNATGLAYIEMMAEFEARENKEQTFDEFIELQLK